MVKYPFKLTLRQLVCQWIPEPVGPNMGNRNILCTWSDDPVRYRGLVSFPSFTLDEWNIAGFDNSQIGIQCSYRSKTPGVNKLVL